MLVEYHLVSEGHANRCWQDFMTPPLLHLEGDLWGIKPYIGSVQIWRCLKTRGDSMTMELVLKDGYERLDPYLRELIDKHFC